MAQYYQPFVFFEHMEVPAQSVQFSWSINGGSTASIVLPSTPASRALRRGTDVQIFWLETGVRSRKRAVVEVPRGAPDGVPADLARQTIRSSFLPETDFSAWEQTGGPASLSRIAPEQAQLYWAGEVVQVSGPVQAGAGASVQVSCQGYEHQLDSMQAIQLIRGRGTLNEVERRVFGQDQPVFVQTGRRGFAQGLSELLAEDDGGLLVGVQRIMTRYASRLNPMWETRFFRNRMDRQVAILQGDTSANRLMQTNAFSRFLREQLQQNYFVPLRLAMHLVMSFVRHVIVPVPSPLYLPFAPAPEPQRQVRQEQTRVRRPGGIVARVGWEGGPSSQWDLSEFSTQELATGTFEVLDRGRRAFLILPASPGDLSSGEVRHELRRVELRGGQILGELRNQGTEIVFTIDDDGMFGGGARYTLTAADVTGTPFLAEGAGRVGSRRQFPGPFDPGLTYSFETANLGAGAQHRDTITFLVTFLETPPSTQVVTRSVEEEPSEEPAPPVYPRGLDRLNSHVIIPDLWWACPPACNVLVPEDIRSVVWQNPPNSQITRLLGRVAPGRSGSGRIRGDKFLYPREGELREPFQDGDEPMDPRQLQRIEYESGVNTEVYYFELLHRLVSETAWQPYLESFLSQEFWSRRLRDRMCQVVTHPNCYTVIGMPMLVIESAGEEVETNQEMDLLLARLSRLQEILAALEACLARLLFSSDIVRRLRVYLGQLILLRKGLASIGQEAAMAAIPVDLGRLGTLWINAYPRADARRAASRVLREDEEGFGITLPAGLEVATPAGGGLTRDILRRYIREDAEAIAGPEIGAFGVLAAYPPLDRLRVWYRLIGADVQRNVPCIDALRRDIERVRAAITDTRRRLRDAGIQGALPRVYIGQVSGLTTNLSAAQGSAGTQTVTLSHVRFLGEDLSGDLAQGDEVENTIAFGPEGFMDDRYRTGNIGPEVYLPLIGCESIAEVETPDLSAEEELEEVDGVWADARDIVDTFEHPEVCGHSCVAEADEARGNARSPTSAALGILKLYQSLVASGADAAEIHDWLHKLRQRAPATVEDCYRNPDGVGTSVGGGVDRPLRPDPYEGAPAVEGFFRRSSFQGGVKTGPGEVDLHEGVTENEADALSQRVGAVREYVRSVRDKAYSQG